MVEELRVMCFDISCNVVSRDFGAVLARVVSVPDLVKLLAEFWGIFMSGMSALSAVGLTLNGSLREI